MLKNILFDLDGTLLPMDQDYFTETYFQALAAKLAPYGYEAKELVKVVWKGTKAMTLNDGSRSNAETFWEVFLGEYKEHGKEAEAVMEEFYLNEFNGQRKNCGFDPMARETVKTLKQRGFTLILASNPVFPMDAQKARMRWAGVEPEDFVYISSYENSRFCKPNPAYYTEILQKNGLKAEECIMVGNDATEDMAAQRAGLRVFLLTACLINREGLDISEYPKGGFAELMKIL